MPQLLCSRLVLLTLLTFFLINFPSKAFALDPKKELNQYILTSWQDGLPHLVIRDIYQSRDGYLWLATYEGLVRFDGVNFVAFDKKNTKEIKNNRINAICEDSLGQIWVGTGIGLICYNKGKFTSYTTKDGLPGDLIYSVFIDKEKNLWIGTNQGLACWKDNKFAVYSIKDGLPSNIVTKAIQDHNGILWVGTGNGISKFSQGQFTNYSLGTMPTENFVNNLKEDSKGTLWIGTNGGLKSFQDDKLTSYGKDYGLSGDTISSITEDREGSLWFGGYGTGLVVYRQGRFSIFSAEQGFSDNIIRSLYEDHEGSLWIGTNSGLSRLMDGNLANYTSKHGLLNDNVRSVCESRDGSIWIGTDGGGVIRFYDNKFTPYTVEQGLARNFVRSVYEDSKGNIWVGTIKGLSKFINGKFINYPINDIFSLYEDSKGDIWVGTYGYGIYCLKEGDFSKTINYTTKDGLSNAIVRAICEDSQGNLWIGTEGGGLNCFRDGKFEIYGQKEGLAGKSVFSIYLDKEDYLWISTENGLNRFKNKEFFLFTTQSGLFDDLAFQILEDEKGNFWISCNKGIYRVNRQHLMDYASGKRSQVNCLVYNKTDGMGANQCNGNSQPAGWRSQDGKLWFPTVKGLVSIDPSFFKTNTLAPNVVVEKLISDKDIFYLDQIDLPAGKKDFEFQFTALSFIAPEKVKFKYKLEGHEDKWSDEVSRRFAIYSNLSPGTYTFKVIACNNNGVWNQVGASYKFSLKPYWWQSRWIYLVEVLSLGGIFFTGMHFREKRLLRRNLELEAKVITRTKEIDKKNEELAIKIEELDSKNKELDKKNEELSSKNAALVRSRDELAQSHKRADLIFSALSDVLPGQILDGKYQIEEKIGSGGFGLVYQGTHLTLMRPIAIKVFRPSAGNTSLESLERFRREGISGSRVNHPNAVSVLDSGVSSSGIAYLVMELLEGHTLAQELIKERVFTPWRCAEILVPVCEALEAAHSSGLIHRDIKPDNIFLHKGSQGEVVKVVDFGIAKLIDDTLNFDLQTLTESGIVGTPTFIAPERLANKPYGGRADVYSVGVILYRMLAGCLPFQVEDKANVWAVALMNLSATPPPVKKFNPNVSDALEALVMKLLAKDPQKRPLAKEVAVELAQIVGFQANLHNTGKINLKADQDNELEASTIKLSGKTTGKDETLDN
ncbi:MAG: protein kinase [Acidobacteria bacterium]|nr:protein kinase [Acidobacteriota bacterium]